MTVSSLICRMPDYAGNGVTTAFAYTFKVYEAGHLRVYLINDDSGQETLQTITTHYTVSGLAPTVGGTVTMVTAPATGESLRIERVNEIDQLTSLKNAGAYYPETVEDAFDYGCMVDQQLALSISDMQDQIDDLIIGEGVDLFDTKIVQGYNAEFQAVDYRNAADSSTWRASVDSSGNFNIAPQSGVEGVLVLGAQSTVQAGLLSYRTLIRSLTDNAYNVTGGDDNARCLRMLSSNGTSNVTVSIPRDADTALTDLFFTNDWLLIQRQTTGTLTVQGGHGDVTITNEYTGVAGSVTVNQKGGYVLLRRTGTNTYVASGDIPKRAVETVVSVASSAGVLTLDWALGNAFTTTLTENITSIVYSNLPSGVTQSILLTIVQHASSPKTVSGWAAGTLWQGGVAPTITATNSAVDRVSLSCNGANSTVLGDFGLAYA